MNKLISQMFDDLFPMTNLESPKKVFNHFKVPVNILEAPDDYKLQLIIPGVTKDNIKIEVEHLTLTVSYEAPETNSADLGNFLRQDFVMPNFKRTFNLSENIDTDKLKAQFNNGILNIILPKKVKVTPEKKELIIE